MSDTDQRRAGAIILENLSLLEKATNFFGDQIQPEIDSAIKDRVSSWMEKHHWLGNPDPSNGFVTITLYPEIWSVDGKEPLAEFKFAYQDSSNIATYEVLDLFGAGRTNFGFKFEVRYNWFGGRAGWNTFAKGLGDFTNEMYERGWQNQGKGLFFRPIVLSTELMAPAWEAKDWSKALVPLEQALDALDADHMLFNELIMKAKAHG